jgi:hypothetical protein
MKDFRWAVQSNQIMDCPVTVQDINVAHAIWGKKIAALKGKTTRKNPIPVADSVMRVPTELLRLHKDVFLTCDIFFVNTIPFFISLSRRICFTGTSHLKDRSVEEVMKAVKEINMFYMGRGFQIRTIHADGEFEVFKPLIESLPGGPRLNLATAKEHVPEIERRIRTVKERVRSVRASLPFNMIPVLLLIHMVLHTVKMLNHFPTKAGISDLLSPPQIMTGETLNYKKHLSLQFGQYCQVHEEDEPRNNQTPRTQGAICLGPTGNLQGGYKFMSLKTGMKIARRSWDVIPMPDTVIKRVNALGNHQPEQIVFTDQHGRLIGDVELPGVYGVDTADPTQESEIEFEVPDDNVEVEECRKVVPLSTDRRIPNGTQPIVGVMTLYKVCMTLYESHNHY